MFMEIDNIVKIIRIAEDEYSKKCDIGYEETNRIDFKAIKSTVRNFSDALEKIFREYEK